MGIDERGLWPVDRRILKLLRGCRKPVGLARIAAKLGLVATTPRGRVAVG